MIAVLSPAKRMVATRRFFGYAPAGIRFSEETSRLVKVLYRFSPDQLSSLMKINQQLAEMNYQRFQRLRTTFGDDWGHAMAAFDGEVYNGLKATTLDAGELEFAQQHVRILSGLYGLLRPMDAILPYRLEMGTQLKTGSSPDLYKFWKRKIASLLENDLAEQRDNILVNLASEEYSKAVLPYLSPDVRVITPVFKEFKGGKYTMIVVYAKKARGMMSRFIIENRLSDPEHLKAFDTGGYLFEPSLSDESRFVFTRKKG